MLSLVTDNIPSWITERRRMTIKNILWSTSTKVLGPDRTHDLCISNRTHYRLLYRAKSFWGSYFISIDPESVNPSFALFDCLGAILCDLLIAGLIGLVYQSGAYEAFAGVLVNKGKWHLFQGSRGRKAKFWGGTETILGNREYKKTKFEGTEEQANLFQRNKETCNPTPPPWEGFAYHLGDRIPPM